MKRGVQKGIVAAVYEWATSDRRVGEKKPQPDRCQFCGRFHFGECDE